MTTCSSCGKQIGFLDFGKLQIGDSWYCSNNCSMEYNIRKSAELQGEIMRLSAGGLTYQEAMQKKQEHEQNLARDFPLLDAEIDKQVEEIRLVGGASSKDVGLAYLQLVEPLHPYVEDLARQLREAGRSAPQISVEGVRNLQSRLRYFLEEAERELRTHLVTSPDDVEILEALATAAKLLGKRDEAVRAAEEAKKKSLLSRKSRAIAARPKPKDRTGLSFENKALGLVEALGFEARTTSRSADGGVDIIAESRKPFISGRYIIQCKDWKNPVGEPALRDLLGAVQKNRAVKGILISRSAFTRSARDFAQGTPLELIDGGNIDALIEQAKQTGD